MLRKGELGMYFIVLRDDAYIADTFDTKEEVEAQINGMLQDGYCMDDVVVYK